MKISAIICSHNSPPAILRRTIAALSRQTLDRRSWELIVVDNASDPPLSGDILAPAPGARLVREERLGLTPARQAGIAQAVGRLLVFVDDDNFLDPDYLEKSVDIADRWPMLGVWGGRNLPEFEHTPPEWTRKYWGHLAVRDCPHDLWSNFPGDFHGVPAGAGLVVRPAIAAVYAALLDRDPMRLLLDRKGKALTSGGDTDLALTAFDLGYGAARFSTLSLIHYMPAARLEERYLLRISEEISYSEGILDAIRGNIAPKRSLLREHVTPWRLPRRERRFWQAFLRGRRRARSFVAKHPELQMARDVRRLSIDVARELGVETYR